MADSTLQVSIDTNIRVLDVHLSTLWPLENALPVSLSTSRIANGDAGSVLPVVFTTTSKDDATLDVLLDVAAPDGVLDSAPATGPVVTGTIQERVGGGITASLQREDGTHPTGGAVSLQHTQAVGDGTYKTHAVSKNVAAAPYGKSWERQGGVPIASVTTPNPGDVLDDTILPELVKVPTLTATGITMAEPSDVEDPPLYSLDARLGTGLDATDDECAQAKARQELLDGHQQSRLQLAQAAVAQAGMSLVILGSIPNSGRAVEEDYTTDGQTAASVLSDMLLSSNPRVWYAPGTVYVDGRTFTGGAGSTDPTAFIAADDLADDGASWSDQEGSSEPEPVLEDYTDRCERRVPPEESDDPDADGTFETFQTGTYSWTERSGTNSLGGATIAGGTETLSDYQEVFHEITKQGGRLTEELEETKAYYRPFPGAVSFGVVSRTETTNEYHAVCPEALVGRTETTMQRKSREDLARFSIDASDEEPDKPWQVTDRELLFQSIPTWFAERRVTLEQAWHAEGWLKARTEVTRELDGMIAEEITDTDGNVTGYTVTLTYRKETRAETFTPIGDGLWHIATAVRTTVQQPIYEPKNQDAVEGDDDYGEVTLTGVLPAPATNSYTVVTDQAPPSVSCGQGDPCSESTDPYDDCIADATERWEIDHADWEARQAHNGPKRVWTIQASRLLPGKRVGQKLGGGLITGVTHALEAVGGSTTLEVWEWLA